MKKMYEVLCASFAVILVMSNILSAKLVKLPFLTDFSIPAGLVTYPFTFFLSALVTELFGLKRAQFMIFLAFGMNLLSLGCIELALCLPAGAPDGAFQEVLGLSGLRTGSSLLAYLTAQIMEVHIYAWLKERKQFLWLRNNGATLVSQLIDTVVIDILFLYLGLGMEGRQVVLIIVFSYIYKMSFSLGLTPLFCASIALIRGKWNNRKQEAIAI